MNDQELSSTAALLRLRGTLKELKRHGRVVLAGHEMWRLLQWAAEVPMDDGVPQPHPIITSNTFRGLLVRLAKSVELGRSDWRTSIPVLHSCAGMLAIIDRALEA